MDWTKRGEKFPNKFIEKLSTILKPAIIKTIETILKAFPKERIVDSIDKCDTEEMKRQFKSFNIAYSKWQHKLGYEGGFPKDNRTNICMTIIKKCYFTLMKHELNYQILSSMFLEEYKKSRGWN